MQLQRLLLASDNYEKDEVVKERIGKGVIYFREETEKLHRAVCGAAYPEIDNKEVRKQLEEAMTRLLQEIHVKIRILESAGEGFSPVAYLKSRAEAVLDKAVLPGQKHQEKINVSADILHPALYRKLCEWRKKQADRLKLIPDTTDTDASHKSRPPAACFSTQQQNQIIRSPTEYNTSFSPPPAPPFPVDSAPPAE